MNDRHNVRFNTTDPIYTTEAIAAFLLDMAKSEKFPTLLFQLERFISSKINNHRVEPVKAADLGGENPAANPLATPLTLDNFRPQYQHWLEINLFTPESWVHRHLKNISEVATLDDVSDQNWQSLMEIAELCEGYRSLPDIDHNRLQQFQKTVAGALKQLLSGPAAKAFELSTFSSLILSFIEDAGLNWDDIVDDNTHPQIIKLKELSDQP